NAVPLIPDYATRGSPRAEPLRWQFKSALLCGALPGGAALTAFLLGLISQSRVLEILACVLCVVSVVPVIGGGVILLVYLVGALQCRPGPVRRRAILASIGAAALLASNVVFWGGVFVAVDRMENRFRVIVSNATSSTVNNCAITYSGSSWNVGSIAAGSA